MGFHALEITEIIDLHINSFSHIKTMVEINRMIDHGHILLKDVITKNKGLHTQLLLWHHGSSELKIIKKFTFFWEGIDNYAKEILESILDCLWQ